MKNRILLGSSKSLVAETNVGVKKKKYHIELHVFINSL